MSSAVVLAFAMTAAVVGIILMTRRFHGQVSEDSQIGPQKFHLEPTPRIGGISVLAGLVAAAFLLHHQGGSIYELIALILFCGIFAFAGGLAEDITKRVGVRLRLLLTFVSATLAFFFLDARISQLHVPGFDWALQFTLVSFAFTLFAVGGFAHAMNIVDGFNGLAGVVALIFLAAMGYVAAMVGDRTILLSCLLVGAAITGFLAFNYPRGLIFLGDGGAYLIGFLIAELAVMLVHRNTEVSPWFALTLLSYPICETVFSIYRKRVLRKQSAGEPDGLHLHMLIYKRLVRRHGLHGQRRADIWANALTSPYLWMLAILGAGPAVVFWNQTVALQAAVLAFTGMYVWLYWRIVRFRTPAFLALRRVVTQERSAAAPLSEVILAESQVYQPVPLRTDAEVLEVKYVSVPAGSDMSKMPEGKSWAANARVTDHPIQGLGDRE